MTTTSTSPRLPWVVLTLVLLGGLGVAQDGDVAGTWRGTVQVPDAPLEIQVSLERDEGGWQGSIDIPAQGASELPLEDVAVEGPEVRFTVAGGVDGAPAFDGHHVEDAIEGTFTQSGREFPFRLERAAVRSTGSDDGDAPGDGADEDAADDAAAAPVPGDRLGPASEAPDPAADTYQDPEGRFTVPVPSNWSVREENGVAVLASPDEDITVYASAVEGDDPEAAIGEAWRRLDPTFDLDPERTQEVPAARGVERVVQITFDSADDRIVQATGQLHDETVYLLLVDADLAAAQRRSSQVDIIGSGFTIQALEEEDLTGAEARELTGGLLADLEAYVADALERFDVPGAAVAVVQNGRIVFARGFGTAGPDGDAVTPETLMMIGSTTKTMTTMMMATLVDEGLMEWDTPVADVLPEFAVADPELSRTITMENLVCACTGVPRRDLELLFHHEGLGAEGVVRSLREFEFFTDFGEAFQYSNQMVATGGYAAAAAGGAEFGDLHDGYVSLMRRQVLGPIGLPYSTFSFDEAREREDRATPYGFAPDLTYQPIPLAIEEFVTPVAPAGALWSNVIDMGRYLITLMNDGVAPDGRRVVAPETLQRTWEPGVPVSADAGYGLGWFVDEYEGLTQLHHAGNTMGFTSDLAFLPDVDVGVSVLTNGRSTTPFNRAVRFRTFELVFGQEHEYDDQAAFLHEDLRDTLRNQTEGLLDQVDAAATERWHGRFTNDALGEVDVFVEEGRLMLDAGDFATSVLPIEGEDRYLALDGAVFGLAVRLSEDHDGEPVVIVGEGAAEYEFERAE